jgi:hypothetical protein
MGLLLCFNVIIEAAPKPGVVLSFSDVLHLVGNVAEKIDTGEPLKEINAAYFGLAVAVDVLEQKSYGFICVVL